MRLNRDKTSFGRHETFPLRYGWLTKGYEALKANPDLFDQPEQAMVTLGVGRNMVNAIQYWLQAVGLVRFTEEGNQPTALGETLLGESGDRYLEDEATLWVIHWLLAANAEAATGLYWFFNCYTAPRFRDKEALQGLSAFVAHELHLNRSQSTLKSDVSTVLRLYAPIAGRNDEHLDSPLSSLQLIEPEGSGNYRSLRLVRPYLPPVALHFALAQRFAVDPQPALPVRAILYGGDGWAAPGAIFRLSEDGLMALLQKVIENYSGCYELRDTAGVHQLYRGDKLPDPLTILQGYYQEGTR